jgi:hypothetical protein
MATWPDRETRATNGPGREWRTLQICSGFAGSERGDFQWTISQPLILREDNPAPLADGTKPDAVLLVASEMVVMNLHQ